MNPVVPPHVISLTRASMATGARTFFRRELVVRAGDDARVLANGFSNRRRVSALSSGRSGASCTRCTAKLREASMGQGALATLIGVILTATSSALATTTAPGTAPAATGGGIGDYWWIILVMIVIAAAIWYFMKGRHRV
jgi:hypothetical protein